MSDTLWTVIHGDCLEVIPTLDIETPVLCMDPPYGIAHASGQRGPWQNRQIANDADTVCRDAVLNLLPQSPALVFGSWKVAAPAGSHTAIVWDKGMASGMGDLSVPWKPNWELIFVIGRGFSGYRGSGILSGHTVVTWASRGRLHPNEKPVSLWMELLSKCPPGTILDPFAGSFSLGVAAVRLGRRYVGIEIDADWAEQGRERLQAEQEGSTLQARKHGQLPLLSRCG